MFVVPRLLVVIDPPASLIAVSKPELPDRLLLLLQFELFAVVIRKALVPCSVDAFDVTHAPTVDIDKPLAERQPGGLGLHLVQQMATTLQYEYTERRSTITFTKSLEAG